MILWVNDYFLIHIGDHFFYIGLKTMAGAGVLAAILITGLTIQIIDNYKWRHRDDT